MLETVHARDQGKSRFLTPFKKPNRVRNDIFFEFSRRLLRENARISCRSGHGIGLLTTETKIFQRPAEEIAGCSNCSCSLDLLCQRPGGGMADAEDLKSSGDFSSCGFDSHPGHHLSLCLPIRRENPRLIRTRNTICPDMRLKASNWILLCRGERARRWRLQENKNNPQMMKLHSED